MMNITTGRLRLVGALAGRTVVLGGVRFVDGDAIVSYPEKEFTNLCLYLHRCWEVQEVPLDGEREVRESAKPGDAGGEVQSDLRLDGEGSPPGPADDVPGGDGASDGPEAVRGASGGGQGRAKEPRLSKKARGA